jgi:bifunctional pyridoxal-dependent enzyme with beta-cystathionase and maltose regulon repressor activities
VSSNAPDLVLDLADYLYYVRRAVGGMTRIVTELGDDRACLRPDLPGANTPYGLLTHCLGVVEYWGGALIAGRDVQRDRAGEFDATGTVAALRTRADAVLRQFETDLLAMDPTAPLRREPESWALGPDRPLTQASAAFHIYEELSQHHGQLEVLRDALNAGRVPPPEREFEDVPLTWLRGKRGVKWHRSGEFRRGPDLIPAWVADMDFPVAPAVRTAIMATVDRGDLGYPDWPVHPLAEPFARRMRTRHGWSPDPAHVRGVTDLIQALQIVIDLASGPGDGVIAHTPNYPPFLATIPAMGRRLVSAPLYPSGALSWTWDHDRLAAEIARAGARILLLVNPQNPTGRVFRRDELERLADLAERHDLTVVSDEIHADLVHDPQVHIPFASLGPDAAARTVTVTSATKAFNLAGLRTAVAHVGPAALRDAWDAQPPDLYGATNVLGVEATLAAWAHGDDWLARLRAHLRDRRDQLSARIDGVPGVTLRRPEAGYLAWLDFAGADLPEDPAAWLRRTAGIELVPGPDFGPGNESYARLNFATSSALLTDLADRLSTALADARWAPAG